MIIRMVETCFNCLNMRYVAFDNKIAADITGRLSIVVDKTKNTMTLAISTPQNICSLGCLLLSSYPCTTQAMHHVAEHLSYSSTDSTGTTGYAYVLPTTDSKSVLHSQ